MTALRRDVAIKVSNAEFSERFTREARAIASLNHTNVCHLYDVGPNYLVMEYVEGEDLKGPMTFDDALPIIQQLIDGIEAAHEKNIIHRDLKPANIKITPEGVVKILDFGLAKATDTAPSQEMDPGNSPTLTMGATAVGTILGTAAYMAPEQAKGKTADKRSDIWSFGVILYELLTGQRLFQGETAVEILGSVLNKDLDISAAPPRAHKLLRWCLEKDRKHRLQSIGDARRMLLPAESAAAIVPPPPSKLPWMIAAALAVALIGALALWAPWRTPPPENRPLVRLDVDLGPDVSLATPNGSSNVILSPDGTRLVYIASVAGGAPSLFIRRFDQPRGTELPGTEGASSPFFSPDGQWVGFAANGKLGKISVEGGAVVPLRSDSANMTGASWGEDGNIVHGIILRGLFRIPDAGRRSLSVAGSREGRNRSFGAANPAGRQSRIVLDDVGLVDPDTDTIDVLSLPDRRRKTVVRGGSPPAIWLRRMARVTCYTPIEPLCLRFPSTWTSWKRVEPPSRCWTTWATTLGPSSLNSTFPATAPWYIAKPRRKLQPIDDYSVAGCRRQAPTAGRTAGCVPGARLSPDGKRLAAAVGPQGALGIQVYDLQRETWSKLTFDRGVHRFRFGVRMAASGVRFPGRIAVDARRRIGPAAAAPSGQNIHIPGSISPDGKRVAYFEVGGQSN